MLVPLPSYSSVIWSRETGTKLPWRGLSSLAEPPSCGQNLHLHQRHTFINPLSKLRVTVVIWHWVNKFPVQDHVETTVHTYTHTYKLWEEARGLAENQGENAMLGFQLRRHQRLLPLLTHWFLDNHVVVRCVVGVHRLQEGPGHLVSL